MLIASCQFYTKFEIIQLPREESAGTAAKSNVSNKMLLWVLRVLTLPLLANSLQSVFSIKHMWLKWHLLPKQSALDLKDFKRLRKNG